MVEAEVRSDKKEVKWYSIKGLGKKSFLEIVVGFSR